MIKGRLAGPGALGYHGRMIDPAAGRGGFPADAEAIWQAALAAVDPWRLVGAAVGRQGEILVGILVHPGFLQFRMVRYGFDQVYERKRGDNAGNQNQKKCCR